MLRVVANDWSGDGGARISVLLDERSSQSFGQAWRLSKPVTASERG